jgi:hypothetical protein
MINLQSECFVEDNDVYVLECHNEVVIVNNNYSGIKLYNKNLELQNTIDIFEGIIIHTVYKNPNKNEVILYCPDNEVFVYLDLDTKFQKVVNFIGNIDESGLSNIFFWSGREVLFLCGNKRYYKIDIGLFSLQELDKSVVEKEYPTFSKILNESSKYLILEGGTETLTCKDRNNNKLAFFDYKNNIKNVSNIPNKLGHEVIYLHGIFLSVHEEFIQAIKEGKGVARVDAVSPYTFLKARKQTEQNANFIVLKGNKSNPQQCILTRYDITY